MQRPAAGQLTALLAALGLAAPDMVAGFHLVAADRIVSDLAALGVAALVRYLSAVAPGLAAAGPGLAGRADGAPGLAAAAAPDLTAAVPGLAAVAVAPGLIAAAPDLAAAAADQLLLHSGLLAFERQRHVHLQRQDAVQKHHISRYTFEFL